MDRIGPHRFGSLPPHLEGHEETLFLRLHAITFATGQDVEGKIRFRVWKDRNLYVSVSATPGQVRLTVATCEGIIRQEDVAVILFDDEGERYVMMDCRVKPGAIRAAVEAEPSA